MAEQKAASAETANVDEKGAKSPAAAAVTVNDVPEVVVSNGLVVPDIGQCAANDPLRVQLRICNSPPLWQGSQSDSGRANQNPQLQRSPSVKLSVGPKPIHIWVPPECNNKKHYIFKH